MRSRSRGLQISSFELSLEIRNFSDESDRETRFSPEHVFLRSHCRNTMGQRISSNERPITRVGFPSRQIIMILSQSDSNNQILGAGAHLRKKILLSNSRVFFHFGQALPSPLQQVNMKSMRRESSSEVSKTNFSGFVRGSEKSVSTVASLSQSPPNRRIEQYHLTIEIEYRKSSDRRRGICSHSHALLPRISLDLSNT